MRRQEAIDLGLKRYFTGEPCPRGHICERYVSSCGCCDCAVASPEKNRAAKARYRAKHRERHNAGGRAWAKKNRKRANANGRRWTKQNPEAARAIWARRRARLASSECDWDVEDVKELRDLQGNRCAAPWCRVELDDSFHVDHVVPLALEGPNTRGNLQLLCPPCNLSKNAKHPAVWARENEAPPP